MTYEAPLSASLLAKWFVRRADRADAGDLDNLKLQKLLFLANSSFLNSHGRPLVRERVEAWKHGPVIDVVYQEYKEYGNAPIVQSVSEDGPWNRLPNDVSKTLDEIWDSFAVLSGWALRELTHDVGPWRSFFVATEKHTVIPNYDIGLAWPLFAAHAADRGPEAVALRRLDELRQKARANSVPALSFNAAALQADYESLESLRNEANSLLK